MFRELSQDRMMKVHGDNLLRCTADLVLGRRLKTGGKAGGSCVRSRGKVFAYAGASGARKTGRCASLQMHSRFATLKLANRSQLSFNRRAVKSFFSKSRTFLS